MLTPRPLRVILYGSSPALADVGAALARSPTLKVLSLEPSQVDAAELAALRPDVVVFDMAATRPDFALLRESQPRIAWMGVDLAGGQVLALAGRSSRAMTPDELAKIIEGCLEARELLGGSGSADDEPEPE